MQGLSASRLDQKKQIDANGFDSFQETPKARLGAHYTWMCKGDMRLVKTVLQLATNRVFRTEAIRDGRLCTEGLAWQTCGEI